MKSNSTYNLLGYLLSIIFCYLAFKDTNVSLIITHFHYIDFQYIVGATILTILFYFLRGKYQQNNLFFLKPELAFSSSLQSIAIAQFYNNILPARLGELIRTYFLSNKEGIKKTSILSYIFVEKLIDLVFILLLLLIIFFAGFNNIKLINILQISFLFLVFIVISISIFIYCNSQVVKIFKLILPYKFYGSAGRLHADIHEGLQIFKSTRQVITSMIILVASWCMVLGVFFLLSWPYIQQMELPGYAFIFFMVFSILSLSVPSAPAGIGVMHYGLFFAVSILNPDIVKTQIDLVAAFVIALHFFMYLIDIVISGSVLLYYHFIHATWALPKSFV